MMNHNNKQPKLRFGGFNGDWVEGTFGEKVTEVKRPLHLQDNEQYQLVTVKRRNEGVVSRGFLYGKDILVKNYSQIRAGDYLISKRQIIHGANGLVPSELDGAIVSNEYFVAVSNEFVSTEFLALLSRTPEMYKKFLLSSYGVDIEKMVFNVEDWQKRSFSMPSEKAEQAAVGALFARLDEVIGGTQRKRVRLAAFKQAMLGKLFVRHGSRAPEMRLQGFGGEWVERKLRDLGYCISGIGFPEKEQGGKTGTPFFKVSDMNLPENEIFLNTANHFVNDEQIATNGWKPITNLPCIFFAKVGAALLLNRKRLVNQPFLLDNNTMAFVLNPELDAYFIKVLFDLIDLPKLAQTGALPSINAKDVENYSIWMPSEKAEQAAIGAFFAQLDRQLALYDAKLDKLGQVKAALLSAALV